MQSNLDNANRIIIISDINQRVPRNAHVVVSILHKKGITELFNDCHQLKYVHMPDDIHAIGDYVFQNCKDLKSIVLPKNYIL